MSSTKSNRAAGPGAAEMARMAVGSLAEIPQILTALEQGTVMIKFFRKRKVPERRVFCLKTDTFEILQYPMGRGKHTLCEESSERCGIGSRGQPEGFVSTATSSGKGS